MHQERVALQFNAPDLPFRNEALAQSFGCTVEDFEDLAVTPAAAGLVFDAMVESKATIIEPGVADERLSKFFHADGSFNEAAFRAGLYKSRAILVVALFFFGKANFIWILVGVKLLHDYRPDIIPGPKELGLFKIWGII